MDNPAMYIYDDANPIFDEDSIFVSKDDFMNFYKESKKSKTFLVGESSEHVVFSDNASTYYISKYRGIRLPDIERVCPKGQGQIRFSVCREKLQDALSTYKKVYPSTKSTGSVRISMHPDSDTIHISTGHEGEALLFVEVPVLLWKQRPMSKYTTKFDFREILACLDTDDENVEIQQDSSTHPLLVRGNTFKYICMPIV